MSKKRPDKSGNCEICGTWRRILQRDRKIPGREGGKYEPSNIQWLCANCHQDKTAQEQSAAHKGRPKPPEQIAKMSAWQIGKKLSAETKEKIRQANLIAMNKPEMRAHISKKAKERWARGGGPFEGKHHSSESKALISAALVARERPPANEPWVELGISKTSYYRRLRNETPEGREKTRAEKRAAYHSNIEKERAKMRERYHRNKGEVI